MQRQLRSLSALCLTLSLGACSVAHDMAPDYKQSLHPGEAVVVFGLAPAGTTLSLRSGDVSGGWFYFDEGLTGGDTFTATVVDGYVVTSIKPAKQGEWFGIVSVSTLQTGESIACRGSKLLTLFVKPGDALYLGDVSLAPGTDPKITADYAAASAFFAKHYPSFSVQLSQATFKSGKLQNAGPAAKTTPGPFGSLLFSNC